MIIYTNAYISFDINFDDLNVVKFFLAMSCHSSKIQCNNYLNHCIGIKPK